MGIMVMDKIDSLQGEGMQSAYPGDPINLPEPSAKQAPMLKRGMFIILEGGDRSGKSTQASLMVDTLKQHGFSARSMRFPDRSTKSGKIIGEYLTRGRDMDDSVIHHLFSKNRWEAEPEIRRLLESGESLVVDRYAYSGVAYSAAKGLDAGWCMQPDVGLPQPDIVAFLDLPISVVQDRIGYGQERYETNSLQVKARQVFLDVLKVCDDQSGYSPWVVLNATQNIEKVHEMLWQAVQDKALPRALAGVPLEPLWNHIPPPIAPVNC